MGPLSPNAVAPGQFATGAQMTANAMIAQTPPPAGADVQPIDLTPVRLPERGSAFSTLQNMRTGVLYYLPAKLFMNVNVENSLRLETNVFQTKSHNLSDMVYRILPDVNLGYAFNRTTRVSSDYFMFRDTYTDHGHLLSRTIHSIGLRGDKDFQLSPNTVLTASYMERELFITRSKAQHDIMPSVSIVRRVGTFGAVYGSVLGQIRWQDIVGGKFQEGDQFYSVGAVYRRPAWYTTADYSLIDNFGRGNLRGGPDSNHLMVLTLEAGRRLHRTLPLTAFVRAQPIFNIGQNDRPGFAGFNLRLFGGIRTEISKPAIFPTKLRST